MEENGLNKLELVQIKKLVSKRDIGIEAFELMNGNVMFEATFLDPYHLIRLNIQLNPVTSEIITAKSEFTNYPHTLCEILAIKAKLLVGLQIKRGITKEVLKRIGGSEGCVHLRELTLETINFAATVLIGYDAGLGLMNREFNIQDEKKKFEMSKNLLKNTCYVYKEDKLPEKEI
jgi:hypothetical protein